MRTYEQLKAWEEIVINSGDEEAPQGRGARNEQEAQSRILES